MLATIAAFRDPWEAHMFRLRLEAEDVPAVVAYEFHIGNNWLWSTALGGVKVQVPDDFADTAFAVKSLCRAGRYRDDLIEEFGDIDDPRCPHCRSESFRRRRPIPVIIFFIVLFVLALVPAWGWVCFCRKCGTKFELP